MSDFGTEVGSSALNAGSSVVTKLLSAIMAFFKHIYKAWESQPSRRLTKEKLKTIEGDNAKKAFIEKIEGRTGYIRFKEMEKAGINCTALGIRMTSDEMKDFSARCKREGIKFTATIDRDDIDKNKKMYNVLCPVVELEKMKKLIDRMNDDKIIEGNSKRIEEILSRGELSEQDKFDIEALKNRTEEIKRKYCNMLNDEQAMGICEKVVNGETLRGVTFDEALDRYTGGELDKSQFAIVCDAQDPSKYIKLFGYNDTFHDKTYIKTDYEVYNGSSKIYQTNDGRFEGRPKYYWFNEKEEMKKIGGFGDVVFKFYSVDEYERWAQNARTQNVVELSEFEYSGIEGRNYDVFCEKLKEKLSENGFDYKDGILINKNTGEPFVNFIVKNMSDKEKSGIAESFVIAKQIENYSKLNEIEADLAVANSTVITTEKGSEENKEALVNYERVNESYQSALDIEKNLKEERMRINGVQAKQETGSGRFDAKFKDEVLNKVKSQYSYSSQNADRLYKDEIIQTVGYYEIKNNIPPSARITTGAEIDEGIFSFETSDFEEVENKYVEIKFAGSEKEDGRSNERVGEIDDKRHNMTEYKGKIEDMRKKDDTKKGEVKDRTINEAQKMPKDKTDR